MSAEKNPRWVRCACWALCVGEEAGTITGGGTSLNRARQSGVRWGS
jgi:hypothetical protein